MQKIIVIILLLFLGIFGFFIFGSKKNQNKVTGQKASVQSVNNQKESPKESYIFVPYWTLDQDLTGTSYDSLIYFGISGDLQGVNKEDEGYKNLSKFTNLASNKKKLLTVRMLDTSVNLSILKDKNIQEKIANESITIAQDNNFSGIVLDFETQGLPFENLINSITSFNSLFAGKTHQKELTFGTLLYGDVFYRVRPYDVEGISKTVDRLYVMAYDFSKAKGDPGPNFPLDGMSVYGYDFKVMVTDLLKVAAKEKLTIIFGMFGYDWTIDEQGRSKGVALSKSTFAFEKFLTSCVSTNSCKTNSSSSGMSISYRKEEEDHIIWFETNNSVKEKVEFLSENDLHSIGYWAYSYF